jgi:hypothetical protein
LGTLSDLVVILGDNTFHLTKKSDFHLCQKTGRNMSRKLSAEKIRSVEWLWKNQTDDTYLVEVANLPGEEPDYVIADSVNGIIIIEDDDLADYVIEQMLKHGKRIVSNS